MMIATSTEGLVKQQENRTVSYTAAALVFLRVGLLLIGTVVFAQTTVTTWHYNDSLTSANMTESVLTPSNVNVASFGKLSTKPVDGIIVGQPLYLPGMSIPGLGVHNVVYVATMHDSVYAFDADNASHFPLPCTSILAYMSAALTTVP